MLTCLNVRGRAEVPATAIICDHNGKNKEKGAKIYI